MDMKYTIALVAGLFAGLFAGQLSLNAGEWTVLFDGEKVNGLRAYGQKKAMSELWEIKDGTLKTIPGKKKQDLITNQSFIDFELNASGRFPGREQRESCTWVRRTTTPIFHCTEMQVLDDEKHKDGKANFPTHRWFTYDLAGKGMEEKEYNKAGEWNKARIVCKDNVVQHRLNSTKIYEYTWGSDEIKAMVARINSRSGRNGGGIQRAHRDPAPRGRSVVPKHPCQGEVNTRSAGRARTQN